MLNLFTVVGGWANNRTLIRRKRQDYDMTVEYNFNILRKDDPLKLRIEISNGKIGAALSAKQIPPFGTNGFFLRLYVFGLFGVWITEVAFIMRYLIKLFLW